MKKTILSPISIILASLLYFLMATAVFAQSPSADVNPESKLVKYCTSSDNGKMVITDAGGKQVTDPITFKNGATVSLDGVVTWKDGSKSTLNVGDCIGVDMIGAVYIAIGPNEKKSNPGMISKR